MSQNQTLRTGGQILVDQLVIQGVERISCVPGESYLAALDAMVDVDIDVLICRHEGGAAMMAEAYGKLTGKQEFVLLPAALVQPMPPMVCTLPLMIPHL